MTLALLVIAFFVNVPLVHEGPVHLWHEAPALVVITALVDLFVLAFAVGSVRRRVRSLLEAAAEGEAERPDADRAD